MIINTILVPLPRERVPFEIQYVSLFAGFHFLLDFAEVLLLWFQAFRKLLWLKNTHDLRHG